MRTILTLAALSAAGLALATQAQAGCGQSSATYCTASGGTSTLPPLSSYFDTQHKSKVVHHKVEKTYKTHKPHSAHKKSYDAYSHKPAKTVVRKHDTYPSGAVSESYSDYSVQSFSGSTTLAGLGDNEFLAPTQCPVAVKTEGQVLGCYNVVKPYTPPKVQTTYYQVVRPVIYVRYPVAVPVCGPVCCVPSCGPAYHYRSRYGY